MAKMIISDKEIRAHAVRLALRNLTSQVAALSRHHDGTDQFAQDFDAIAHAITDLDWDKPPRPRGSATLPPFRKHTIRRRLPFGPLRRMARLISHRALRYVFAVGSDNGTNFYRLELRQRLDKEFRRENHHKQGEHQTELISFGNAVLELERIDDLKRNKALGAAATKLGISASLRSQERRWQQFRSLCLSLGYVPSSLDWMGKPPQFALADLDGNRPAKLEK